MLKDDGMTVHPTSQVIAKRRRFVVSCGGLRREEPTVMFVGCWSKLPTMPAVTPTSWDISSLAWLARRVSQLSVLPFA